MDTTQFVTHLIATARANLPYSNDARQAARAALQEAHSALSQREFFSALDALGGQEAAVERVEQALQRPTLYRVMATDPRHGGSAVQGVYATSQEAEARQRACEAVPALAQMTLAVEAFEPVRPLRDAVAAQRQALKQRLEAEGLQTDPLLLVVLGGEPTRLQRELLEAYDALGTAAKHLSEAVYEQEGQY